MARRMRGGPAACGRHGAAGSEEFSCAACICGSKACKQPACCCHTAHLLAPLHACRHHSRPDPCHQSTAVTPPPRQGGDLRAALSGDAADSLSWRRHGKQVAVDIAAGIAYLHSHNVMHRWAGWSGGRA